MIETGRSGILRAIVIMEVVTGRKLSRLYLK